ncbi:MAG TPA: DUF3822 family protein [Chitinophagaceae bacterium]|nr:DUF3822 family protein [Chitinophagaceae bacterium]
MKTLFEIGDVAHNDGDILAMEIGETHISISSIDGPSKKLNGLKVFTCPSFVTGETVSGLIDHLSINGSYKTVVISPAFPQALLIPKKLFNAEDFILQNTFELDDVVLFSDHIGEWQLVNSYALPESIHQVLEKTFPGATYLHAYSPLLKIFNGYSSEQQVAVYFIHSQFRVVVKKDQNVQLVQTYSYATPMDVVYFILKILLQFDLQQEDTQIIISGFIEQDSALYKELYNYFLNLHFSNISYLTLPENDYPKHYFTSINNLAACVL